LLQIGAIQTTNETTLSSTAQPVNGATEDETDNSNDSHLTEDVISDKQETDGNNDNQKRRVMVTSLLIKVLINLIH